MPTLVPLTCFIIIFFVFQKSQSTPSWRVSFLSASVAWGLLLTAITEFLSIFRLINFWALLGLWLLSIALASICLTQIKNNNVGRLEIRLFPANISRFELSLLAAIAFIIITVGIIAWIAPPNTWDSMTYHMSRVVHWIQDQSVEHYPTSIYKQLSFNPWAEFAILHFQILSGGDRFANLVQWFSMIGATLGISLIAKQLGAGLRGQILAAVIGAAIPMGILQGSSTQNDYVVSFWLVCFIYYLIQLKANDKYFYALATGAGLGLAFLTKATAYIYAFPFMAWVSLSLVASRRTRGLLQIILIVAIAFVINLGYYTRNYTLYGNPFGPADAQLQLSNNTFTISSLASNVLRNIGLHIGTPYQRVNTFLENRIYQLHKILGIDPNDPRTTFEGTKFHIDRPSLSEDIAGNPLHLILIILATLILILQQRRRRDNLYYFVCLAAAFLLFCLYLKWQLWGSRLQLPLFILFSPLIGSLLSQLRFHKIVNFSIVILLLGAIPYLVNNHSRPIIGQANIITTSRINLYFKNRASLSQPYIDSAQFLSQTQCSNIGLILGPDDWEYPFWVLLGQNGKQTFRLEHVGVTNISRIKYKDYPFNAFTPCAVIVVNSRPPDKFQVGDVSYLKKWFSNPVGVFLPR